MHSQRKIKRILGLLKWRLTYEPNVSDMFLRNQKSLTFYQEILRIYHSSPEYFMFHFAIQK